MSSSCKQVKFQNFLKMHLQIIPYSSLSPPQRQKSHGAAAAIVPVREAAATATVLNTNDLVRFKRLKMRFVGQLIQVLVHPNLLCCATEHYIAVI